MSSYSPGRNPSWVPEVFEHLRRIEGKLNTIMADLSELTAQVATNTSVEESALTLIKGLAAQLAAAGTDPAKLKALSDQLASSDAALAAAITANTPVVPTPPTGP